MPRPEFVAIPYEIFIDPTLTATEKLALGRLGLYSGRNGYCYPSQKTLARELCLHERQIRNVLTSLKQKGMIDWRRTQSSCIYMIVGAEHNHIFGDDLRSQERQSGAAQTATRVPIETGSAVPQKRGRRREDLKKGAIERLLPFDRHGHRAQSGQAAVEQVLNELRQIAEDYPGHFRLQEPAEDVAAQIAAILGGHDQRAFWGWVADRFKRGGRSPQYSNGPHGPGLIRCWAHDYSRLIGPTGIAELTRAPA